MLRLFDRFRREEDGATTVDWVLLTAGTMSLALAVFASISAGTEDITHTVSTAVASRPTTISW